MPNNYETYGEMFGDFVKRMAKFSSVEDVIRVLGIKYFHYQKVINPNNETSSGSQYLMPVEWLVSATNHSARQEADGVPGDYCMAKQIAKDTNGVYLSASDVRELKAVLSASAPDPLVLLEAMRKIVGE